MSDSAKPGHNRDADLCACLDDECGPGQRRRAENALAQDPALARKLAVWRRNDSALRAAFSANRPQAQTAGRSSIGQRHPGERRLAPLEAAAGTQKRGSGAIAAAFLAGALSAGGAFAVVSLLAN